MTGLPDPDRVRRPHYVRRRARRWSLTVPGGDTASPAVARRFCHTALAKTSGRTPGDEDGLPFTAPLIVSELVTNALNAGASAIVIDIDVEAHRVRISVRDDAPGLPRPLEATTDDVHGRGLAITAALADSWGVAAHEQGKSVWAVVSAPGAAVAT